MVSRRVGRGGSSRHASGWRIGHRGRHGVLRGGAGGILWTCHIRGRDGRHSIAVADHGWCRRRMGSELVLLVLVRELVLGMVKTSIVCLVTVTMLDLRCRFPGRYGLHGHSKVGHIVGGELYTSHIGYRPKPVASREEERGRIRRGEKKKRRMPKEPRNRPKNQPKVRTSWRCSDNPAATAHTNQSIDGRVGGVCIFAPDNQPGSNGHSSDQVSTSGFRLISFLFVSCFFVFIMLAHTQRKEAKGYFWRGTRW